MSDDGLFEFDAAPHVSRETSKADIERKNRIIYHRRPRRSRTEPCADCVGTQSGRIRPAVYIRKHGDEEILLCFEHKQDREDREFLDGPKH